MEPPLNCSALSQSHIETTLDRMEALGVLEELCRTSTASDKTQLSVAMQGILGSLLTCGVLLSLFFIFFTVRFRQNRIVKMSSPNLNLLILLGSLIVYISAFMFAVQESASSIQLVIQVRISLLYVGVSLVFGPLLGKSWRLHRVFTHRIPDKRVIIKDLTLLGLQAALLFIDAVLLLSWVLSDPVLCAQNVSASIKAAERGMHCAVTRVLSCSSRYGDFWVTLLLGFKGILLIYGSYLAGLTKNISTPPVNQSLVIMVGTTLVTVGTGVVILVTRFFHTWPNLVYGVTSSSILICTTTINCLIFIPQLLQWRQFEEEPSHTNNHMAKYFNSPSKSKSMYSEEQIYHLLGENTSMRRLLTEKNAVIDSLQEQVTNAKEKLVQLLKSECSVEITEVSTLSASTLTIQQQVASFSEATNNMAGQETSDKEMDDDTNLGQEDGAMKLDVENSQPVTEDSLESPGNVLQTSDCSIPKQETGMPTMPRNVNFLDSTSKPQSECTDKGTDSTCEAWERLSRKVNYVSSEKLQEILRELSVEALSGGCQLSPGRQRRASHSVHREPIVHSEGFQNISLNFSPSMARRRRGLAYSRRNVGSSTRFYKEMPQASQRFINQGAREGANTYMEDTVNHTAEMRLDESNDDISQHLPSSPTNNIELEVQMEGTRVYENGGLWISKLSDQPNYCRRPSQIINWIHAGQDTRGSLGFRSDSPFSESDTSSSEETFCICHRPYCDICFPDMCETSDTETESTDYLQGWPTHLTDSQPVVNFKEDLQPTFV